MDRFFDPNYQPTDSDILRCRNKTTGIIETTFPIEDRMYRIFDVGGQRSERKKWIHCFEGVTAVLFLVSLSGYDSCLVEDKDANQMQEALMLFDSICNSKWFTRTSMVRKSGEKTIKEAKINKLVIPFSYHTFFSFLYSFSLSSSLIYRFSFSTKWTFFEQRSTHQASSNIFPIMKEMIKISMQQEIISKTDLFD